MLAAPPRKPKPVKTPLDLLSPSDARKLAEHMAEHDLVIEAQDGALVFTDLRTDRDEWRRLAEERRAKPTKFLLP